MLTRKPIRMLTEDADTEGTDVEEPEGQESTEQPEASGEPDTDDDDDAAAEEAAAFDADRALKKIRKANSEAKTQRERAKAAEERVKGLEPAKREAAEQRVARKLGLPDNEDVDYFLSRLQGESADELAADAERLLSLMSKKEPTARKPKERLRGGGEPDAEPEELDPAALADRVVKARGY